MKKLIITYFTILSVLFFSCESKIEEIKPINAKKDSKYLKDTLDAEIIIDELKSDMWNNLVVTYYDKNRNVTDGITNNKDTFFLQFEYKSKSFRDLAENYELELKSLSDICKITKINDEFRLIVNSNQLKDTLEYEVYLSSPKYLFKSRHYLDNTTYVYEQIRLSTFIETFSLRKKQN